MKASLAELRVFVAVAESGHFTRAAERLGMSQSSLSAALVKLENQLGTRLFDRHTRACRPTEAGAALLPAARRLVADWEHLLPGARDFSKFSRGRVDVAAPNAQCALLLPPVIRAFPRQPSRRARGAARRAGARGACAGAQRRRRPGHRDPDRCAHRPA